MYCQFFYSHDQAELASLKKRAEDVLKENQKLRLASGGISGQGDSTEWYFFDLFFYLTVSFLKLSKYFIAPQIVSLV